MTRVFGFVVRAEERMRTVTAVAAVASALLLAITLAATPGKAWAYADNSYITDVYGNVISDGVTVDINVLQQGILFWRNTPGVPGVYSHKMSFRDSSGRDIASIDKYRGGDGYTFLSIDTALVQGETYTFTIVYGEGGNFDYVEISRRTLSFTMSGGQQSGMEDESEAEEVPSEPSNPQGSGQGDGGMPDGGTGSQTDSGEAGTNTDGDPQNQEEERDPASGNTSVSEGDAESEAEEGSPQPSSPASDGADDSDADGGNEPGGEGSASDTAQGASGSSRERAAGWESAREALAESGGGAAQVSGDSLRGMGSLFTFDASGGDATAGRNDGDGSSAIELAIIGLPYLWVVVVAVFLLALPSGLVGRLVGSRRGMTCRSRLA